MSRAKRTPHLPLGVLVDPPKVYMKAEAVPVEGSDRDPEEMWGLQRDHGLPIHKH